MTGTSIAQAIPIAISPILTRLYTPEQFGLMGLYVSIVSVLFVIANGRYEIAIVLPEKENEAKNLLALSVTISTSFSLFLMLIILLFNDSLTTLFGSPEIEDWLYFIPVSVFFMGLFQAFNFWGNREKQFRRLAINRVAQAGSTGGGQLATAPLLLNGLVFGQLLGHITSGSRLAWVSVKKDKFSLNNFSLSEMKDQAVRYKQFPQYSLWSGFLNSFSLQLPVFILTSYFTGAIVGFYTMSNRILNMPMNLIGRSVAQVFYQQAAEYSRQGGEKLKNLTFKTFTNLMLVGIIPMGIIFGFGDYLFAFVFGAEWEVAGDYARILSPWILFVFVTSPLSNLFSVLEKQHIGLIFNIMTFALRLAALLIGAIILGDALMTIILFSVSGLILFFARCLYTLWLVGVSLIKASAFTIFVLGAGFGIVSLLRYVTVGTFI